MSKVTLEFTLPDEQNEFDAARQGSSLHTALWYFDQRLRNAVKHEGREEMQAARDWLHEELAVYDIRLDP